MEQQNTGSVLERKIINFVKVCRGARSQDDISRILGREYSRRQISGYERGELVIPAAYLVRLSQETRLSLDAEFLGVHNPTDIVQAMIGRLDARGREQLAAWVGGYLARMVPEGA